MNRKKFIAALSLASTAHLSSASGQRFIKRQQPSSKRSKLGSSGFRLAHVTDPHISSRNNAPEKIAAAFRHIHDQKKSPIGILSGGDSIMDALRESKKNTKEQWRLWNDVVNSEVNLPLYPCIGNHDVWGWGMKEGQKDGGSYGKKWAMDELKLQDRYYSFSIQNWEFIVLDSVHPSFDTGSGYTARLDEEQFQWLETKLNNTSTEKHICILSHIPIISFCPFFDGPNEEKGKPNGWLVPHEWMHIDARRIKNLFKRYDNIRTCISGHIHLQDSVEYLGIKYFCNGALSGNWWNSQQPAYQEFEPAYAMLDFSSNGEIKRTMIHYDE